MNDVNLSAVDLNLLLVVDAVLQERSATRAAARLHLTQSAVSNALRRARALFGDPLVVRAGRGLVMTPRAEALAPRLQAILAEVRELVGGGHGFEPGRSTREFTIACTDAVGVVLIPALLATFADRLPNARLRTVTLDRVVAAGGLAHADVDLLIGAPPSVPPGCEAEELFCDPMVAIVREDHPRVRRKLRLATYAALDHAEFAALGEPEERVDRALAVHGLGRPAPDRAAGAARAGAARRARAAGDSAVLEPPGQRRSRHDAGPRTGPRSRLRARPEVEDAGSPQDEPPAGAARRQFIVSPASCSRSP